MKKYTKLITLLLVLVMLLSSFAFTACAEHKCNHVCPVAGCGKCLDKDCKDEACKEKCPGHADETPEKIDFVSQFTLNENSSTAKTLAKGINLYVDGDTTHFKVDTSVIPGGILKARYAAINTPESTGDIEPWGFAAKRFTNDKLAQASSILLESPTEEWKADSTGSRYMCWVWYKTSADADWRNLNVEILQEGLAIANGAAGSLYGDWCTKAITQARTLKLYVYSSEKDPDVYEGAPIQVSIKDLRANTAYYKGKTVSFTGVVAINSGSNGVYVEQLDADTGLYFGMYVYYGYTKNSYVIDNLKPGNLVRVVGSFQEFNGTYQIADLDYNARKPDDPTNTIVLETGHSGAYVELDPVAFTGQTTITVIDPTITDEDADNTTEKTFDYAQLILNTTVTLKNFKVTDVYTTKNEASASKGAITLTGECEGEEITVRTVVLYDDNNNLVTEDYFDGKTFDIKGVVDAYDGDYQIKLFRLSDATLVSNQAN